MGSKGEIKVKSAGEGCCGLVRPGAESLAGVDVRIKVKVNGKNAGEGCCGQAGRHRKSLRCKRNWRV